MNKAMIILIIVLILGGIGIILVLNSNKTSSVPQGKQTTPSETGRKVEGYQGNVLAGNVSPLIEFNKADYRRAKAEGKIIILDFYANWCPICRFENPKIISALKEFKSSDVVAFQVHYNDGDVTEEHIALAKEYGINLQHTKVILKDGEVALKSLESWSKDRTVNELRKVL
mgnify:CR=1 FL=1